MQTLFTWLHPNQGLRINSLIIWCLENSMDGSSGASFGVRTGSFQAFIIKITVQMAFFSTCRMALSLRMKLAGALQMICDLHLNGDG
jgi:hypothetical protein